MKTKRLIWGILTLIWVAVIFSFSLQPGDVSSDISSGFGRKILELLIPSFFEKLEQMSQEQLDFWHLMLRKCAHFTEFMILGMLSSLTLLHTKLTRRGVIAMCFCVAIASIDETIQLFVEGRAGRVQDVLLDGSGAFVGVIVVFFVIGYMKENSANNKVLIG